MPVVAADLDQLEAALRGQGLIVAYGGFRAKYVNGVLSGIHDSDVIAAMNNRGKLAEIVSDDQGGFFRGQEFTFDGDFHSSPAGNYRITGLSTAAQLGGEGAQPFLVVDITVYAETEGFDPQDFGLPGEINGVGVRYNIIENKPIEI